MSGRPAGRRPLIAARSSLGSTRQKLWQARSAGLISWEEAGLPATSVSALDRGPFRELLEKRRAPGRQCPVHLPDENFLHGQKHSNQGELATPCGRWRLAGVQRRRSRNEGLPHHRSDITFWLGANQQVPFLSSTPTNHGRLQPNGLPPVRSPFAIGHFVGGRHRCI